MTGRKTVELYYDVISPYSWLAFEALTRYQNKWNINLKLKPFLLGAIMKESGNQPPAMLPNKAVYMPQDLHRLSQLYKVPLSRPTDFMGTVIIKGSMSAQRFITSIQMLEPEKTEEVSRQLWMRVWRRDEDIVKEDSLRDAAKKAGINDTVIEDALQKMKTQQVKDKLRAVTQEAVDQHAFGAPFYVADGMDGEKHRFFGCDRIEALAFVLGERYEGPLGELSKL